MLQDTLTQTTDERRYGVIITPSAEQVYDMTKSNDQGVSAMRKRALLNQKPRSARMQPNEGKIMKTTQTQTMEMEISPKRVEAQSQTREIEIGGRSEHRQFNSNGLDIQLRININ